MIERFNHNMSIIEKRFISGLCLLTAIVITGLLSLVWLEELKTTILSFDVPTQFDNAKLLEIRTKHDVDGFTQTWISQTQDYTDVQDYVSFEVEIRKDEHYLYTALYDYEPYDFTVTLSYDAGKSKYMQKNAEASSQESQDDAVNSVFLFIDDGLAYSADVQLDDHMLEVRCIDNFVYDGKCYIGTGNQNPKPLEQDEFYRLLSVIPMREFVSTNNGE